MVDSNTKVAEATNRNREQWLTDFIALSLPLIKSRTGLALEDRKIQISCGFPSSGVRIKRNGSYRAGECHHTHGTQRKSFQVFIHPGKNDPVDIGETVLHEVLHALLPGGVGHRKPFAQAAKKLGLEGKPTSTVLGEELTERVKEIVGQLGDYPHESVWVTGKKQTTRLLKAVCQECGHTIRTTQKWIDAIGYPVCPCNGQEMGPDEGDYEHDGLVPLEQHVEYKVKAERKSPKDPIYDPRWAVRMMKNGKEMQWYVIDYGPAEVEGKAVLGVVQPRLTAAESREDAVGLLQALRDDMLSYKDIEANDDEFADDEWFDDSPDELADDEPEMDDNTDDFDPRFEWEKEKGIEWNYDNEATAREAVA